MIRKGDFQISDGLARESEVHARSLREPWMDALVKDLDSPARFISWFEGNSLYADFLDVVGKFPAGRRVLDVGVGLGYTSVYCSLKGHSVTAIEPSPECCSVLDRISTNVGENIDIWNSTAEHPFLDRKKFDLVIFHSSLHHCDAPGDALRNAYASLADGGACFLVSEPVLNCFRSKAWYEYMLEKFPEAMGHHGGNEHIYRAAEYEELLEKAGFRDICANPSCRYKGAPYFHSGTPPAKRIVKKAFYHSMRYFLESGLYRFFHPLFKRMSLLQYTFVGTK